MKYLFRTISHWPVIAILAVLLISQTALPAHAQAVEVTTSNSLVLLMRASLSNYFDQDRGLTVDEVVAYALSHNGELIAARKEIDAARSLVKQAALRANPMLETNGTRQIAGSDNSVMVSGSLPLELGGRRRARITVAEIEVELRELEVVLRERTLAAEVRSKFGEALANVYKLGFTEDLLKTSERGYRLVAARVVEGRTAPLEQNMTLVEVNRLRSMRETNEGKVEVAMLELRNLIGMYPEEPLKLRGDFRDLVDQLPSLEDATENALRSRPELLASRAAQKLAKAQIEQARAEGRLDASVNTGYQRMSSGFPVFGFNEAGALQPVMSTFHFLTFGVTLNLPVRNKNQGAIEASVTFADAARIRLEFAQLTVRREVASAYTRYDRAARAMEIFRVGVQGQASDNLDIIYKTYELGSRTLLDYIAEQRRFIEVQTNYIDAVLETYQARVEVSRVSGSAELMTR